jgi:TetR/AcrR family transcriptional regulator
LKDAAGKKVRRRRDPVGTRKALLDAGRRLFAERGFAGATIEQIADLAGVNKALIGYYFGGKRALQDAIHAEAFELLAPRLQDLRRSRAPAEDRLREFISAFASLAEASPDYPVMILRGLIAGEAESHEAFASRVLELNQILADIIRDGRRSGQLRPVHPLLTQASIVGSVLFFFATTATRERLAAAGALPVPPPVSGDFVRHLQDLVAQGLVVPRKLEDR